MEVRKHILFYIFTLDLGILQILKKLIYIWMKVYIQSSPVTNNDFNPCTDKFSCQEFLPSSCPGIVVPSYTFNVVGGVGG